MPASRMALLTLSALLLCAAVFYAATAQAQVAAPLLDPTAGLGGDLANPAAVSWSRTRVSAASEGVTLTGVLAGSVYTDPAYVPCPLLGFGNCAPGPDGSRRTLHGRYVGETFAVFAERKWQAPDNSGVSPVAAAQSDQAGVAVQLGGVFSLGYGAGQHHLGEFASIAAPGAGTYSGAVRSLGMTLRLQERWYLGYHQRDDEASIARIVGLAYATETLHLEYAQETLASLPGGRRKLVIEGKAKQLIMGLDLTRYDIDLVDEANSYAWYVGLAYDNGWSLAIAGARASIFAPALATDYDEKIAAFRFGYAF